MEETRREQLLRIYAETGTIAVVGASADASKAAHQVPRYLQSQGYRILPVNPCGGELFGEHVFPTLAEIDVPMDVVEVFRPAQVAPEIARQAVAIGAKVTLAPGGDRVRGSPTDSVAPEIARQAVAIGAKVTLAPGGDRVRGSPTDSRGSRADRRYEPLYGSHARAARSGTRTSRIDRCLSGQREGSLDAVLRALLPK